MNQFNNAKFQNDDDITAAALFTSNEFNISCTYCRRNHPSAHCTVISDINARKAIIRNKAKCFVCLKSRHVARVTCVNEDAIFQFATYKETRSEIRLNRILDGNKQIKR